MIIYCVYGYTGGNRCCREAAKTDAICEAIYNENMSQGNPPCLICGDINCNTSDLPFMRHLLGPANFVDVGAQAASWCANPGANTCKATNTDTATRRDYMFAHPKVVPLLHRFTVGNDDELLVHFPLTLTLKVSDSLIRVLEADKCPPLDSMKPDHIDIKEDWRKLVWGRHRGSNEVFVRL